MELRGFVKYRLPGEEDYTVLNGFWVKVSHLKGYDNVDFVISNYDNSFYYIFHANDDEERPDLEECYRKMDQDEYLNFGEYQEKIIPLIKRIQSKEFSKVIFSRRKKIGCRIDPNAVFKTLNIQYKNSFNYLLGIEGEGVWMGATPEVLIETKDSHHYHMHSLAGTVIRDKSGEYKWTSKEIEEHQYVTDYLLEAFDQVGIQDVKLDGPNDFEHGRVAHIKTEIEIKATEDQVNEMMRIVPPTPAVCGIPKGSVLSQIQEIEGYDRKFYTGTLGIYKKGNVHLFVNLRCMEVFMDDACLYLGGGITAKSDPEKEWDETELKSRTLLDML
ncbi:MAG: chorismate-binding protein [Crocinitomicaceae bacterium]|nr:chorismate-binding protein [Crocinitomicaceae bacterium]